MPTVLGRFHRSVSNHRDVLQTSILGPIPRGALYGEITARAEPGGPISPGRVATVRAAFMREHVS
jgi:hypothetical protein